MIPASCLSRVVGLLLAARICMILAGILGLVYGSFSYTKKTHEAKLGPIELSIKKKQTVIDELKMTCPQFLYQFLS
jgi:hypothetical protein